MDDPKGESYGQSQHFARLLADRLTAES